MASDLTYLTLAEIANKAGLQANKDGNLAEALEHFKEANELVPDDPRFLLSAANMSSKIGIAKKDSALVQQALNMYAALSTNPRLAEHPRLAEMATTKRKLTEQALAMLDQSASDAHYALQTWWTESNSAGVSPTASADVQPSPPPASPPLPPPGSLPPPAPLPPPSEARPVPPPPPFPTLEVSTLGTDGTYRRLQINSRTPVPIETPLFSGCLLLLVRPETEAADPFYSANVFKGKRRRFEVQVQGRFKRPIDGTMYTGGEVLLPQMQLGLLTKGVARGMLSLISAVLPIHYSFGQPKVSEERPHIVSPLMISADRMIITPDGQPPPRLGTPGAFDLAKLENEEARKRRRQEAGQGKPGWSFDTASTYTFSFNTSNIDLPSWQVRGLPLWGGLLRPSLTASDLPPTFWQVRGLPLWGDLDLHNFWQDGALRIVSYLHRPTADRGKAEVHVPSTSDYAFCIQIQHVDPATRGDETASLPSLRTPPSDAPLDGEASLLVSSPPKDLRGSHGNDEALCQALARDGSNEEDDDEGDDDDDDDEMDRASYATAVEDMLDDVSEDYESAHSASAGRAPRADQRAPAASALSQTALEQLCAAAAPETAPVYLRGGAGSIPARIDVQNTSMRGGSHTSMLLVSVDGAVIVLSHAALGRLLPRRLWASCSAAAAGWGWSPRLLAAERQRRLACYALDTWLASFESTERTFATSFSTSKALPLLQAAATSASEEWWARLESPPASTASARLEGAVLLVESEAHLREERLALVFPSWRSSEALLTIGRGKALVTLPLDSIVSCAAREGADSLVCAGACALEIGTLGRVTTLIVAGEEARDAWLQAITGSLPSPLVRLLDARALEPLRDASAADPTSYLHKSAVFRCAR